MPAAPVFPKLLSADPDAGLCADNDAVPQHLVDTHKAAITEATLLVIDALIGRGDLELPFVAPMIHRTVYLETVERTCTRLVGGLCVRATRQHDKAKLAAATVTFITTPSS